MLELSRTVRFCLSGDPADLRTPRHNTFSAWPAMRGLGRYYELAVTCRGQADPQTGYFINITQIDRVVRDHALPLLNGCLADERTAAEISMGRLMNDLLQAISPGLGDTVDQITLGLTPYLRLTTKSHDMEHVFLHQQYEFSAAHRLHVPTLSDEENRDVFGKCNNPAGHGHNYRVEVTARCPIDAHGRTIEPATLDAIVDRAVIEKLDHKHLNTDVPEFAELNPSVENIVRVIWTMLAGKLPGGAVLDEVRVWETGKTVCAYRGEPLTNQP